jgi:hypothetical protein
LTCSRRGCSGACRGWRRKRPMGSGPRGRGVGPRRLGVGPRELGLRPRGRGIRLALAAITGRSMGAQGLRADVVDGRHDVRGREQDDPGKNSHPPGGHRGQEQAMPFSAVSTPFSGSVASSRRRLFRLYHAWLYHEYPSPKIHPERP